MKLPRHFLCPTEEDPDRRRLIVRDGELVIGILEEVRAALSAEEATTLRQEEVRCGPGIERVGQALEWRARVPGFGYLELDEAGVPRIVPAVTVSEDRLVALLDLRLPAGDEQAIHLMEIFRAIRAAGIVHGYASGLVQGAWKMFQRDGALPHRVRFAFGTRPLPGHDGRFEWEIDVERRVGEVDSDQGRIDFYERRFVANVRAGQRLGVWHPAVAATPGRGVDGTEIPAAAGPRPIALAVGSNLAVQEAENGASVLLAEADGMLVFDDRGVPRIIDTLEVPGDVDLETGNIDATGSVVVRGSIRSELRVTASRDLHVHGTIEAADVEVGGSLVVDGGIVGDKGCRITAEEDVTIRRCQNATIKSGRDVRILDSDLNSTIECKGNLIATEGRGRLRGGTYVAGGEITVREAGSELGAPTVLSVGLESEEDRRLEAVRQALQGVWARMRLARRLEAPMSRKMEEGGGIAAGRRRPKIHRDLLRREAALKAKLATLEARCSQLRECRVTVLGQIHPGVLIVVNGKRFRVKGLTPGRRFQLDPLTREIEAQLL
ncbi:MAG: FapA family protein [Planctomycetota bacterium]